jgi:hypothetical protein
MNISLRLLCGLMFSAFKIDDFFSAEKGDAQVAQSQVGQTTWANRLFPACYLKRTDFFPIIMIHETTPF